MSTCDGCGLTLEREGEPIPLTVVDRRHVRRSHHWGVDLDFCSIACLADWVWSQDVHDPGPIATEPGFRKARLREETGR